MDKKQLLATLQSQRNSKVISYVTSDRPGPINARVALDIIPLLSKQLQLIGKVPKIDLFLYSAGGDTMVPWRLVSMLREFCDHLSVIIPYKAHSAATMIALGADEIVMTDLSEISPIDPSTANTFNPSDPANPQNKIQISVEDVIAYFDLAKNKFGIKSDENLSKIFNKFIESTPQIHPLSLGNVNRIHNLIRLLAKRLLLSHKNPLAEGGIEKIVEYFTEKLYSHQYFIGRKEAKEELGLKTVSYADGPTSSIVGELFKSYSDEMMLDRPWNPELELGFGNPSRKMNYKIAFIESEFNSNVFVTEVEFRRQQTMITQQTAQGPIQFPQEQITFNIISQGWN